MHCHFPELGSRVVRPGPQPGMLSVTCHCLQATREVLPMHGSRSAPTPATVCRQESTRNVSTFTVACENSRRQGIVAPEVLRGKLRDYPPALAGALVDP